MDLDAEIRKFGKIFSSNDDNIEEVEEDSEEEIEG